MLSPVSLSECVEKHALGRPSRSREDAIFEREVDVRSAHEGVAKPAVSAAMSHAILAAAARASTSLSRSGRQDVTVVRKRYDALIEWLMGNMNPDLDAPSAEPPVTPRAHVNSLRSHLLAELSDAPRLDAREVVRTLTNLERAAEAWKNTDRGKFILRLTGFHSVDAVLAIAHDLRSPLGSILLLVDALRQSQSSAPDPVRDRYLRLIYGATLGLSTTIDNLVFELGGGVNGEVPTPFSLAQLMQSVSDIVQPMCEEKGIPLTIEFPKIDLRVGYASGIHQALLNLASNAVRHTDSGSVTMGCTELSGNHVEFWVQDTGPGIRDDALERFCSGFTPEDVAMRFSGAGLGLAIVRALVDAMGSTLQVDTGAQGTRFCFLLELPVSQDDSFGLIEGKSGAQSPMPLSLVSDGLADVVA